MRSSRKPRKGFGRRLLRWTLILVLGWVGVTALPVVALRWIDPPTSAFMVSSRYRAWAAGDRGYHARYTWVDYRDISPDAALAVIASEDQLFPEHRGFDVQSIRKAAEHNDHSRRVHGASTISQQVAKNLFLWSGRSYLRKAIEAWLTMEIELLWPKQRILEVYLNVAQFGKGIYGVEAASRAFYRVPAARLNAAQAATLAAVLPNPLRMHPQRPSRYVTARSRQIEEQMRMLGGRAYLKPMG